MPSPDLAALAARHDAASRDTYLTLYADLTDDRHGTVLDVRAREIRAALAQGAVAAFEEAHDAGRKALRGLRGRGAAVFVSPENDFLEAHALAERVPTKMVLDSSPYVRPLARFADEYESFALVLLDGGRGAVYLVENGRAESRGKAGMDLIGRHKKGGMSQARYQRHRQGRVEAFYDEVSSFVEGLLRDGETTRVVVAGPGNAKRQFASRLPRAVAEQLVAVEDADFDGAPDDTLVRTFVALARRLEREGSDAAVEALRTELLRGDLATTGPFEVARAARDGRVDLLVVLKDHVAGGRKCEEHRSVFATDAACACGNRGTEVDLVNEAVEWALVADSRIEFVANHPFLRDVGGVGAVLRW